MKRNENEVKRMKVEEKKKNEKETKWKKGGKNGKNDRICPSLFELLCLFCFVLIRLGRLIERICLLVDFWKSNQKFVKRKKKLEEEENDFEKKRKEKKLRKKIFFVIPWVFSCC